MVRSSKLKRPVRQYELLLTRGGGAQLFDRSDEDDEPVWSSDDDEAFAEEFDEFLTEADVDDILDYLEEIGELGEHEADQCEVLEEYYQPADLVGMFR